jgi:flavin reductase (DIM6/NTAB) family NADH-FMN oxidoreductase RutF
VSILNQEQRHLSSHFAGRPLPGVEPEFVRHGNVSVLRNAVAVITADVVGTAECGDHTLFIGLIDFMSVTGNAPPIVFYGGHYVRIDRDEPIEEAEPPLFW